MTHTAQKITPLRKRMIEDMTMRKLSPKTQTTHLRAVIDFTRFLGQSPDTATAEDLRGYQLHLVEEGIASGNLNARTTALKFFFGTTLEHSEVTSQLHRVHEPRTIPVVLSLDEVTRLLQAADVLPYRILIRQDRLLDYRPTRKQAVLETPCPPEPQ